MKPEEFEAFEAAYRSADRRVHVEEFVGRVLTIGHYTVVAVPFTDAEPEQAERFADELHQKRRPMTVSRRGQ